MIVLLLLALALGIAALAVVAPIFLDDPFKDPPPWHRGDPDEPEEATS